MIWPKVVDEKDLRRLPAGGFNLRLVVKMLQYRGPRNLLDLIQEKPGFDAGGEEFDSTGT
jgi:hypothetical protein